MHLIFVVPAQNPLGFAEEFGPEFAEGGVARAWSGQIDIFDAITQEQYKSVFALMRKNSRVYPNYIFALTMGTGKTRL